MDAVGHLVADVLPRVRQQVPGVGLYIIGMDPTPAVRKLADGDRVVVTGRVEDVRPYLPPYWQRLSKEASNPVKIGIPTTTIHSQTQTGPVALTFSADQAARAAASTCSACPSTFT